MLNRRTKRAEGRQYPGGGHSLEAPFGAELRRLGAALNAGPAAQRIARIQQRVNGGAGPSPVAGHSVQRLRINGERIRPYGKSGKALWLVVKQAMFENGMSPHGAKKVFINWVKTDRDVDTQERFIGAFIEAAKTEVLRVEGEKKRPKEQRTRGWTRLLSLERPAWTEEHKSASVKGEDLRHIIRNATLRKAIQAEFRVAMQGGPQAAFRHFSKIASAIGVAHSGTSAWEIQQEIYKTAYLNMSNLFPGPAGVNRVIGLTADMIYKRGKALVTETVGLNPRQIEEIFDWVAYQVASAADSHENQVETLLAKRKISKAHAEKSLEDLEEFYDTVTDYIMDVSDFHVDTAVSIQSQPTPFKFGAVWSSEIGRILMDIGANFGFDLPLESTMSKKVVGPLIKVEQILADYDGTNTSAFVYAMKTFLELPNILK